MANSWVVVHDSALVAVRSLPSLTHGVILGVHRKGAIVVGEGHMCSVSTAGTEHL